MAEQYNTKVCRKCNVEQSTACFSKHSGTADKLDNRCKTCVKKVKEENKKKGTKLYEVYALDLDNKDWQAGKPNGTILERVDNKSGSKRYEVRLQYEQGKMSKSFAFNKYASPELAYKAAKQWQIEESKNKGITRNMIRILDDETIEVQLTQNMTMKTDLDKSDLCQQYMLCATKSGTDNSNYYAALTVNNNLNRFHNFITGFNMVDHINRDPMDNRMCNLRNCDYKLNNNNRSVNKKYETCKLHELGVRYVHKDEAFQARIKQDGREYTKQFSIKKYGFECARQMAIEQRKEFNKLFDCHNGENNHTNKFDNESNSTESKSVYFDDKKQEWVSKIKNNNTTIIKLYSIKDYGYDGAKLKANMAQDIYKIILNNKDIVYDPVLKTNNINNNIKIIKSELSKLSHYDDTVFDQSDFIF